MKKIAVSLAILLAIAGGAFGIFVFIKKAGVTSSLPTPPAPSQSTHVSDLASRAAPNTLALLTISTANMSPAIQSVERLSSRISDSAIWKKLDGDRIIQAMMEKETDGGESKSPKEVMAQIQALWSSIVEITALVGNKNFSVLPSVNAPSVLLNFSFNSEQIPNRGWAMALEQARSAKEALLGEGVDIKAVDEAARHIKFSIKKEGRADIPAIFGSQGKEVRLAIGTENFDDFFASAQEEPLTKNQGWISALSAYSPRPGIYLYANTVAFVPLVADLMKSLKESLKDTPASQLVTAESPIVSSLKEMETFSASLAFNRGVFARQCTAFTPDAPTLETLRLQKTMNVVPQDESLLRLITPQTLLSLRISKNTVMSWLHEMKHHYRQMGAGATLPGQSQDWAAFNEKLEKTIVEIEGIQVDELGLIVNQSAFGPLPEIVGYFGSSEKVSPEKLAESINRIAAIMAPEIKDPVAEIREQTGGGKELELSLDGSSSAWLVPVSDHVMMAAQNKQSMQPAAALLSGSTKASPFLSEKKLSESGISTKPEKMAVYYYISTRSALELVKPLLPFVLMQRPDLEISNQEIDDATSILSADIFVSQTLQYDGNKMVCLEGQAVVLK